MNRSPEFLDYGTIAHSAALVFTVASVLSHSMVGSGSDTMSVDYSHLPIDFIRKVVLPLTYSKPHQGDDQKLKLNMS